jgi:D-beta-D-heptose 7-phosphate kinase/D-beta-D-heptose 1-phosphate adenosyltransferase
VRGLLDASNLERLLRDIAGRRVVVVGDYMLDEYLFGEVRRVSPEAPVPIVSVNGEAILPGGAGNVARNLRALGLEVTCCGVLGADETGTRLQQELMRTGAVTEGLLVAPEVRTTRKTRVLARGRQVARIDRDNEMPLPRELEKQLLEAAAEATKRSEALVLCDYDKGGLSAKLTTVLIDLARASGVLIVADPKPQNILYCRGADVICPNASEAGQATGAPCASDAEASAAAKKLLEMLGLAAVLITRSEKGLLVLEADGRETRLRAITGRARDVTGAGDTVTATVTAALLAGATYSEAAVLANLAAGCAVQRLGCAAISCEELKTLVQTKGGQGQCLTRFSTQRVVLSTSWGPPTSLATSAVPASR